MSGVFLLEKQGKSRKRSKGKEGFRKILFWFFEDNHPE
jgi:hypothetical protein